ncbi:MAG: DUF5908 family protein [Crocinitomicaceae bacterium]|nr:DUF5908 family protein [Crocinitomicaceae bacterium]
MPIEIKEMHIKINVSGDTTPSSSSSSEAKETVIEECMEQVMKVIKNKDER